VSFTDDISVGRWATEHETSIVDHYFIVCVCDHNRVCVLPGANIPARLPVAVVVSEPIHK
jgi:hypothetical protein